MNADPLAALNAELVSGNLDFCFWHLAEVRANQRFGRYRGLSGHQPAPISIAYPLNGAAADAGHASCLQYTVAGRQ